MNQERKKGTGILEKNRFFRSLARNHVLMACTVYFILKVPKRENFSLAFFALSEPISVCELGTDEKSRIFLSIDP
jgi:hypothetical protein